MQELFGEALAQEEQKFAAAAQSVSTADEATIQRLGPRARQGLA